ncbi:MAG TPA: hypothetical protein VIF09_04860 [Polyangiaceae bacterium]|jgi:hypothetical protein
MFRVICCLIALSLAACCSATGEVTPPSTAPGVIETSAKYKDCAKSKAKELAEETCRKLGKTPRYGEATLYYQGADPGLKTALDVSSVATRGRSPGSGIVESDDDYLLRVMFRCE